MGDQHNEAPPAEPPPKAPRWQWALLPAIPLGIVGSYVFGLKGLDLLRQFGYITDKYYGDMIMIVMLGCLGGLPAAAVGGILGGLASWPLGKFAARRWGSGGALLAGVLAGIIGALLVTAGFVWFVLL